MKSCVPSINGYANLCFHFYSQKTSQLALFKHWPRHHKPKWVRAAHSHYLLKFSPVHRLSSRNRLLHPCFYLPPQPPMGIALSLDHGPVRWSATDYAAARLPREARSIIIVISTHHGMPVRRLGVAPTFNKTPLFSLSRLKVRRVTESSLVRKTNLN
jgi:hypothetical protein